MKYYQIENDWYFLFAFLEAQINNPSSNKSLEMQNLDEESKSQTQVWLHVSTLVRHLFIRFFIGYNWAAFM